MLASGTSPAIASMVRCTWSGVATPIVSPSESSSSPSAHSRRETSTACRIGTSPSHGSPKTIET
jgi:hypothetical protein